MVTQEAATFASNSNIDAPATTTLASISKMDAQATTNLVGIGSLHLTIHNYLKFMEKMQWIEQ